MLLESLKSASEGIAWTNYSVFMIL